ncbi:hypothetical protein [Natronobiforma cellulositropha]|uniref:hypothetical protein n=1 Tax=Natronobiforma cellulositropha TaxID=1679076 RepID=UPI0021D57772|nr:hypothetical protein [Natronobiforma cellulositropha]
MIPRTNARGILALALVTGIVHAVAALWLSGVVRGRPVGALTPATSEELAFFAVTVGGLVALGATPVVLRARFGLVTPALALVTLFVAAFLTSWRRFETARAAGASSIDLSADSLFGPLWVVPLVIVLVVGGLEFVVRRRVRSTAA